MPNFPGDSGTGAALDTIQVVNSAVSAPVSAWGSTVPTTFTAAGQTLTLPTIAVADIGKSITVQNAGTFPFSLAIASGSITSAIGLIVNAGSTVQVKAVSTTSAIVVSTNASQIVGLASGVVSLASSVPFAAGNSSPATSVTVFTIPLTVGSWDISPHLIGNFSSFVVNLSASILCGLFDTTGTLVPGSETNITRIQSGNAGTSVAANLAGNGLIPVNVTVPGNYTVRVWNNGATGGGSIDGTPANANILGQSRVSYKQTVGALPVSTSISAPQGFAHISIKNPSISVQPTAITSALAVGSTLNAGNLTTVSGNNGITLKAGKNYFLQAAGSLLNYGGANTNFPNARFDICTGMSTTVIPGCSVGVATMMNLQSTPSIGAGSTDGDRPAYCFYTPTVDTVVNVTLRSFGSAPGGAAMSAVLFAGELTAIEVGMQAQVVAGVPATATTCVVSARNQSGQSIPNGTNTTITGWTIDVDPTSSFTSAGVFTAPRNGNYRFSYQVAYADFNPGITGRIRATLSPSVGSERLNVTMTTAPGTLNQSCSQINVIWPLLAGQTVITRTFQSTGAARPLESGFPFNTLAIEEIAPSY
jgi:hypothetical protein